jgi:hypothetical protein
MVKKDGEWKLGSKEKRKMFNLIKSDAKKSQLSGQSSKGSSCNDSRMATEKCTSGHKSIKSTKKKLEGAKNDKMCMMYVRNIKMDGGRM